MEEDQNSKESLLTKKEWVEYIDKLINRASAHYNRSGITIWVIIAALAVLMIRIVDVLYSQIIIDIDMLYNLYCCFALFFILILILIVTLRNLSNSKIRFLTSYIEEKRNRVFVLFVSGIIILLSLISSSQYKLLYPFLSFLLVQYLQVNNPWFLPEGYNNKRSIINFRIYIISLKNKHLLCLLSFALCLFLLIDNLIYIDFKSIPKEILLFSLYSFAFICLLILLIYTLTGGYELKHLKYLESIIISGEIDDTKTIEEFFNLLIIGLSIQNEIKSGFEYSQGIIEVHDKKGEELLQKWREIMEDPEKKTMKNINEIYEITVKLKNNSRYFYCTLLNQKATLILEKKDSILKKNLDEIIRKWYQQQRILKDIMRKVCHIKRTLIKEVKANSSVNGGMVI